VICINTCEMYDYNGLYDVSPRFVETARILLPRTRTCIGIVPKTTVEPVFQGSQLLHMYVTANNYPLLVAYKNITSSCEPAILSLLYVSVQQRLFLGPPYVTLTNHTRNNGNFNLGG
jgi:hypothetical protein